MTDIEQRFLQATSLPFIVAAVQIGQRLGALPVASGAALIAAGLASVLFFPAIALAVLRSAPPTSAAPIEDVRAASARSGWWKRAQW